MANPSSTVSEDQWKSFEKDLDLDAKRIELRHARDLHHESIQDLKQDREQRWKFASRVYILVVIWLTIVLSIVVACGVGSANHVFELDTTELTTLVGATTASVLGLLGIAIRYLFPNKTGAGKAS